MTRIETKEHLIYTGVTVERQLLQRYTSKQIDLSYVSSMYIILNFQENPMSIIGEVQSLYIRDSELKAKLCIYKYAMKLNFNNPKETIFVIESMIPAIGIKILPEDKGCKVMTVSLGVNNQDITIKSIGEQLKQSMI